MLHPVPSALALALAAFLAAGPALADTATSAPATAPPSTSGDTEASNNFSIVRYRADYQVRPDAGNVQTETYEVLLKTKASVEQFTCVGEGNRCVRIGHGRRSGLCLDGQPPKSLLKPWFQVCVEAA